MLGAICGYSYVADNLKKANDRRYLRNLTKVFFVSGFALVGSFFIGTRVGGLLNIDSLKNSLDRIYTEKSSKK